MVDRRIPGRDGIFVSLAEVKAAQMKVRRMLARGEVPSRSLRAIANARAVDVSHAPQPQQ